MCLVVYLWPVDELCLTLQCLRLNEPSWRHGSMTGVLQKARLCAMTTKQGPRLCLGAGTAERACLDSECHSVLYSHGMSCVMSQSGSHSQSAWRWYHSNLTGVMFADGALFLVIYMCLLSELSNRMP